MAEGPGGAGVATSSAKMCGVINVSATAHKYICNFVSEFLGTYLLVFLGCMGCMQSFYFPNSYFQMNFNFGLAVLIVVECFCYISGAHVNPSVTLAAVLHSKIEVVMGIMYLFAQCAGATAGYATLRVIVPKYLSDHSFCIVKLNPEVSVVQGICIETIITFCLISLIGATWDTRNPRALDYLQLGLSVSSLALTAGAFTGGCMNSARAFGPAVVHLDFQDHYVYWIGPLTGSVLSCALYKLVYDSQQ